MRVCLVAPPGPEEDGAGAYRRLAALLSGAHEVTLVSVGGDEPTREAPYRQLRADPERIESSIFAGPEHLASAAVMRAVADGFAGSPPDYLEVADRCARGLVSLMARRCGDPLLDGTRVAVRLLGSAELRRLHAAAVADHDAELQAALEREQMRLADLVVSPGGAVLDLYRRYYSQPFDAATELALPIEPLDVSATEPRDGPLRILYLGELSRGGGALDLADALLRLGPEQWQLTMYGADTPTAALGQSVRLTIEAMFDGDPRVELVEPGEGDEPDLSEHDLLVVPPTLAIWPEPALRAIAAGIPVLATPVGVLPAFVGRESGGWLSAGLGAEALRTFLAELVEHPEEVAEARSSGDASKPVLRSCGADAVLAGYESLLAAQPSPPSRMAVPRPEPLVTGVVPYFKASAFIEEALRSFLAQTHRNLEAVIVNDGSFDPADRLLDRLAEEPRVRVVTQLNGGESTARNLGARFARGEFVFMLDADNLVEPEFVTRALAVFDREPDLAYVSCWLRFINPDGSFRSDPAGYAPLGNSLVASYANNWDGDTVALVRRGSLLEQWGEFDPRALVHGDWDRYRRLRENGRFGVVIPEYLCRYRVLASSLMRAYSPASQALGWEERASRRELDETEWIAGERD